MESKTRRLRLFPLSSVLFPGGLLNLHVFEPRYLKMVSECLADGEAFGVVLIREGDEAGDPNVEPYEVGSVAEILDVTPLERGRLHVATLGGERFKIIEIVSRDPYIVAEVEPYDDITYDEEDVAELEYELRKHFAEYRRLLVAFSVYADDAELPLDPTSASFAIADSLQIAEPLKQRMLEISDTKERLVTELGFLRRLLPQLQSLVNKRRQEIKKRDDDGPAPQPAYRSSQERFFGKYFSTN
jgi:Lon protease-like protein